MGKAPVAVGVIGAGNISDQYLANLVRFPCVRVAAIADIVPDRARAQAAVYGVPEWGDLETVLGDPGIELVVNLTVPEAHAGVSEAAISAGKHVWCEKPLGRDRGEARRLLDSAARAGLRVGCAPDTVLGAGIQTAKRVVQQGGIGEPLFASTAFQWSGPEVFHPDPAFLYAPGAGPLLDMGPYYMSALVHLLGPIAEVSATAMRRQSERTIRVGPKAGRTFAVDVPTTVVGLIRFSEADRIAQSLFSTDSPLVRHGTVEVHGTEGTLIVPDPNTFGGPVSIVRPIGSSTDLSAPQRVEAVALAGTTAGRGIGVVDMVEAIREEREHVASGQFAYHVLDALLACEESIATHQWVPVSSDPGAIGIVRDDFGPLTV